MVWNKHISNAMKNLTRLCYQMSSKSINLINVFIWITQIKVMSLYIFKGMSCLFSAVMIHDQATMKILTNKFDIKDFDVVDFILWIKSLRHLMVWYCSNLIM